MDFMDEKDMHESELNAAQPARRPKKKKRGRAGKVIRKTVKIVVVLVLAVGAGIIITLSVLDELFEIVYTFYDIADSTGIERGIFSSILKIIGIGYLTEFANGICVDSGAKSIGDKLQFAGKVVILQLALPILENLIEIIAEILP